MILTKGVARVGQVAWSLRGDKINVLNGEKPDFEFRKCEIIDIK